MNKNKKIMTGLIIGALVLTFTAIFMGFAGGWTNGLWVDGKWSEDPVTIKFWDIIFNKNNIVVDGFDGKSSAALIVVFILTLMSVIALATLLILNLTGKANKNLNKGLMIALAVILILIGILMILSKGICGVADEKEFTSGSIKNKLAAGPICWAVFSLISGAAMIVATVQNKKAFA